MSQSQQKFRPVLTHSQISHILTLCKKDLTQESISCIAILAPFEAKIKNLGVQAAYTQKPKDSKLTDLGFQSHTPKEVVDVETLYSQYMENGENISDFSLQEIQKIQEYRYTNDLMTPQEEIEYEEMQLPQLSNLFKE